jgi:nucleoside 2-deoxyribosyltransferase
VNNIAYLTRYRRVYLATPYSLFKPDLNAAYVAACRIAGALMREGIYVFCPVAHSHGIAVHGAIDPLDHAFWLDQDCSLQDDCDALVIAQLPGWDASEGIKAEFAQAMLRGQPIHYLDPERMVLTR